MALVYFLETGWQLLGRSKLHLEPFRNKGSKETLLAGCSESKYMTIKGHSQIITYVFLNISKLTKEPTKSKTIQKNVLPGACSINTIKCSAAAGAPNPDIQSVHHCTTDATSYRCTITNAQCPAKIFTSHCLVLGHARFLHSSLHQYIDKYMCIYIYNIYIYYM